MILLDTVSFLWLITGAKDLSKRAKEIYLNKEKIIYLSSISFWEIIVKYNLSRLPLPEKPSTYIPKQRYLHGIEPLSLEKNDVSELEKLPKIHSDPFDRMLICQALSRNLVILTPDKTIQKYPVTTDW